MSKSKHTAGDWRVGGGGLNILATRDDGKPVLIGTAYIANDPSPSFKDREEAEANARLMAAAPKLLAAIKAAVADMEERCIACGWESVGQLHRADSEQGGWYSQARVAIALAEART